MTAPGLSSLIERVDIARRYKSGDHEITRIPGLFYRAVGSCGGRVKLLGVVVYKYNISSTYGYSDARCWIIPGVVAFCFNDTRNGTLKHCQRPGWHVRWFRFSIKIIPAGFEVTLRGPDAYVS